MLTGGVANYRSSEGKSVEVPYRGPGMDDLPLYCGFMKCS